MMSAVLNAFDDPFTFLREQAARVIGAGGRFVPFDWFRQPTRAYVARRLIEPGESEAGRCRRALTQFRIHNAYTPDDWRWILASTGMRVAAETSAPHPFARVWLLRTG